MGIKKVLSNLFRGKQDDKVPSGYRMVGNLVTKEGTRPEDRTGWEAGISVRTDDAEKAWKGILPVLEKYNIGAAQFRAKGIPQFRIFHTGESAEAMDAALQEIEVALRSAGVRSGIGIEKNTRIPGSAYASHSHTTKALKNAAGNPFAGIRIDRSDLGRVPETYRTLTQHVWKPMRDENGEMSLSLEGVQKVSVVDESGREKQVLHKGLSQEELGRIVKALHREDYSYTVNRDRMGRITGVQVHDSGVVRDRSLKTEGGQLPSQDLVRFMMMIRCVVGAAGNWIDSEAGSGPKAQWISRVSLDGVSAGSVQMVKNALQTLGLGSVEHDSKSMGKTLRVAGDTAVCEIYDIGKFYESGQAQEMMNQSLKKTGQKPAWETGKPGVEVRPAAEIRERLKTGYSKEDLSTPADEVTNSGVNPKKMREKVETRAKARAAKPVRKVAAEVTEATNAETNPGVDPERLRQAVAQKVAAMGGKKAYLRDVTHQVGGVPGPRPPAQSARPGKTPDRVRASSGTRNPTPPVAAGRGAGPKRGHSHSGQGVGHPSPRHHHQVRRPGP
ncbi:MAG: hypothetical protein M3O22_02145 [Pseudomonadota bacterium]|nr:hypothetical protein [Pseudomonadota bacterium]